MESPPLALLLQVLKVFDVSDGSLRTFRESSRKTPIERFLTALAGARCTIITDGTFHPGDTLLEFFARLHPLGIKATIEEEDPATSVPITIGLTGGAARTFQIRIPNDPDLNDLVFALQAVLPENAQIFAIRAYDGTDTYGHCIQSRRKWDEVRTLLGAWFDELFDQKATLLTFERVAKYRTRRLNFVQKKITEAEDWIARMDGELEQRRKEALDVLEANLNSPYLPSDRRGRRSRLEYLGTTRRLSGLCLDSEAHRVGTKGLLALWRGDPGGWRLLRLSLEYSLWDFVTQDRLTSHPYFGAGDLGCRPALALTLGEWGLANVWCDRLPRILVRPWSVSGLSRFMVTLYGHLQPSALEAASLMDADLGVYEAILFAWNDPTKLAAALTSACDYHVMRWAEDREFSAGLYAAFAAEIFAVYRVREKLGLETPRIDHSLLEVPWAVAPDQVELEPDAFLSRFCEVVQKETPEVWQGMISATNVNLPAGRAESPRYHLDDDVSIS